MFDWADDPITKFDLMCATGLIIMAIYGALAGHREKLTEWLPRLLKAVRDREL